MKKMIAAETFPYGLVHVQKDDSFDAHDEDADMLEHAGLARLEKVKGRPKGAQYETKVMTAGTTSRSNAPDVSAVIATPETPAA